MPKLKLDSINETNFSQNKGRINKRNKTTLVMSTNYKNSINNKEDKEKEEEVKVIQKTEIKKKEKSSLSKSGFKNFFTKNDFIYFN